MNLKFYTSAAKGLKLKVRKFSGLIPFPLPTPIWIGLTDPLEHDSLPLFCHGITYKLICSYCITIIDLLIAFSIVSFHLWGGVSFLKFLMGGVVQMGGKAIGYITWREGEVVIWNFLTGSEWRKLKKGTWFIFFAIFIANFFRTWFISWNTQKFY